MTTGTHYAEINLFWVDSLGSIIHKNDLRLSGVLRMANQEYRVIPNPDVPNSLGYPRVDDFILAEAADDYVIAYRDKWRIVTSMVAAAVPAPTLPTIGSILGSNLIAHWDVSDAGSLTMPVSNITVVADQGPNGYDFKNLYGPGPTLDSSTFGLPTARILDGPTKGYMGTDPQSLGRTDVWVVSVGATSANGPLAGALVTIRDSAFPLNNANIYWQILRGDAAGDPLQTGAYFSTGSYDLKNTANSYSVNTLHLARSYHSPTKRTGQLDSGSVVTSLISGSITALDMFLMGAYTPAGLFGLQGWWGEAFVAAGDTSSADIDACATLLQTKWGTP